MKSSLLLLALLFVASIADAQGGSSDENNTPPTNRRYSAMSRQSLGAASSGERIIRNANDCAPDRATPVWANSSLIGYSCVAPSANGS